MVYRFRVTYEEHEDVFRDIEIKASHTFDDFHNVIQQAINFDNSKTASFFITDDYWRREQEIPLVMNQSEKEKRARAKKDEAPKRKVIADYVNDPHQKFIYVFDPEKEWTFQIELIKILPPDGNDYPKCVKSSGTAPKQYKEVNLPPPPPEDDEEEPKKKKTGVDALLEELQVAPEKNGEDDEEAVPSDEDLEEGEEGEEDGEEKPGDEDEEGESSDAFNFDDED
jgi:hypothetical protein